MMRNSHTDSQTDTFRKETPTKRFLSWVGTGCHLLAFFSFLVALDVLFLGGFRLSAGGLKISATHLRNPIFLTIFFTLAGKGVHPPVPVRNSPIFRAVNRARMGLRRVAETRESPLAFWLGFAFLNVLIYLPPLVLHLGETSWLPVPPLNAPRGWYDTLLFFVRRENQDFFRVSGEVFLMATVLAMGTKGRWKTVLPKAAVPLYLMFFFYQIYEASSLKLFGERPLLYSDVLLIKDAAYLLIDTWSARLFDSIVRIFTWALITLFLIRTAFRLMTYRLHRLKLYSRTAIVGLALWPVVLFSTFWFSYHDHRPTIQWISPRIAQNIAESIEGFTRMRSLHRVRALQYYDYSAVQMAEKPNVYIFLIESYGKILLEHPDLVDRYLLEMKEVEQVLNVSGWHSTTNFSASPISGGRSWLSMASLLGGIHVDNQAFYSLLIRTVPDYPHLIRFLEDQGYRTIALQPVMRPRPGFSLDRYENFFDYDVWIYRDDLDYQGEHYGWGAIPDQYSLNYAHETFIKAVEEPFCLVFPTVTSHAPWYDLPPYVEDWKLLNDRRFLSEGGSLPTSLEDPPGHWPRTRKKLSHHLKKQLGLKDVFRLDDYFAHMMYQIHVISDYIIEKAPDESVIVIIGDHQPPVITHQSQGFETVVHIVSKDQEFVDSFQTYGFVPGGTKDPGASGSIRHEGVYSMVVRAMAERYGVMDRKTLPDYRPSGLPLSILRP